MNQYQFQVSIGKIVITWTTSNLLHRIEWFAGPLEPLPVTRVPRAISHFIECLENYFSYGKPIDEIPWSLLERSEWTPFQQQVYETIAQIPHGETRTYGWVASRVKKVAATRAVGQALRKNPLPILIPCHRVVAVNSLGGFMGLVDPELPELKLKKNLLSLEQEYLNPVFNFMATTPATGANSAAFAEDEAGQLDFFLPVGPFSPTVSQAPAARGSRSSRKSLIPSISPESSQGAQKGVTESVR